MVILKIGSDLHYDISFIFFYAEGIMSNSSVDVEPYAEMVSSLRNGLEEAGEGDSDSLGDSEGQTTSDITPTILVPELGRCF